MTNSVIDFYKKRVGYNGIKNMKDGFMNNLKIDFEKSLLNDPSSINTIRYYPENKYNNLDMEKEIRVIISDISKNDQKSFDEKMLLSRKEDKIDYGTYIKFDDFYWIVNFKEHQTHNAYNKHVIRRCNKVIKLTTKEGIYEFPVNVRNLTQYSDGMQDIVYTSISDNKVSLLYAVNDITKKIKLGDRFIISGNAYRVTFIEDYQFNTSYEGNIGLGSMICVYDPIKNTDDVKEGTTNDKDTAVYEIEGSSQLIPGGTFSYVCKNSLSGSWEIEYLGKYKDFLELKEDKNKIKLKVKNEFSLIGESVKIIRKDNEGKIIHQRVLTVDVF